MNSFFSEVRAFSVVKLENADLYDGEISVWTRNKLIYSVMV